MSRQALNSDPPPDAALALCAWLDGQLPSEQAAAVAERVRHDPALSAMHADFRWADQLLRGMQSSAPVNTAHLEGLTRSCVRAAVQARQARGMRPWPRWLGLAVAAAVMVIAIPALQGRRAHTYAQDSIGATAHALMQANGVLATLTASTVKRGAPDEAQSAVGNIKFGSFAAPALQFASRQTWITSGSNAMTTRAWGQSGQSQWFAESGEGYSVATEVGGELAPGVENGPAVLSGDFNEGSPVDVRTRQSVEGLYVLLKSFNEDRYLQWMGCRWTYLGGEGTSSDPWRYSTRPPGNAASTIDWTVCLWTGSDQVIEGVELSERVTDARTGAEQFAFKTSYMLTFNADAWPADAFESRAKPGK